MGSLTCDQMRQLEEDAFRRGATAEGLMEKAGQGIAAAIIHRYPNPGTAIACIGSGNSGGDALVALKYLRDKGWQIGIRCLHPQTRLGALPRKKWRELGDCPLHDSDQVGHVPGKLVLLDGLLGIGASGPLRSPLDELAEWINRIRTSYAADVIAMDIPSGVDGDTGRPYPGAVVADLTLTVGVPKLGLLQQEAVNHTGAIEAVPLEELPVPAEKGGVKGSLSLVNRYSLQGILPRRPHDFHKGDAGRVGILAGSEGMLGAAVLCSYGALRGGAGLVTLFARREIYPMLASMLPAEVMVKPVDSFEDIDLSSMDAVAVGPGIGLTRNDGAMLSLIHRADCPVVLDADGINRMARGKIEAWLKPGMILTPHPGEMKRMFPEGFGESRIDTVRAFVSRYPECTLLLKGARSLIASNDRPISVNGSGNAGMASGGQGDVLTGVIAALLAQGTDSYDSACLGAWLCGRAAELAVDSGCQSQQSLIAGDVIGNLGQAFASL